MQERESGKRGGLRPVWQEPLTPPQAGETLKFWKFDRWGHRAVDVLTTTLYGLCERQVTVVSLFGVLALAAEYELELRAERQAGGIASAPPRQAESRMLPGEKHIGCSTLIGPPSSPPCGA